MRLLLIVLLLLAGCTQPTGPVAQSLQPQLSIHESVEDNNPNRPESNLVFEPDHIDVGSLQEGEAAVVYLRVRNAGDQMGSIVSVTTSCGCTVAEPEQKLLMPGGFTRIKVAVDTFAKQENVRKWIELTDGQGRRRRAWLTMQVTENPHMADSTRTIFDGKCAACHFTPATEKRSGPAIYDAVCVMCHGNQGQGAYAPKLAGHKDPTQLAALISKGTGSRHMPGFAREQGGPLDRKQIEILSQWLSTLDE
ncbi:MAG: DUF1573 domain-containing protein [Mariprofundus sp.]